jgi:hypothetical protein
MTPEPLFVVTMPVNAKSLCDGLKEFTRGHRDLCGYNV